METDYFYLVVRPVSEDPGKAESCFSMLSDITGLDAPTLRQRVIGSALRVLKTGNDPSPLQEMADELEVEGFRATVLNKAQILAKPRPVAVKAFELGNRGLGLLDKDGEVVLRLHGASRCFLVLASLEPAGLQKRRMSKLILGEDKFLSLSDRLSYIFNHSPIMDVYVDGSGLPFRIDSSKFNYHSLEEHNTNAVLLNFPFMIGEIKRNSAETVLESGFGECDLPFLSLMSLRAGESPRHREDMVQGFAVYSCFVSLAHQGEMFRGSGPAMLSGTPMYEQMEGVSWTGCVPGLTDESVGEEPDDGVRVASAPGKVVFRDDVQEGALSGRPGSGLQGSGTTKAQEFFSAYTRYVRMLGPPAVFYPLTAATLVSCGIAYFLKKPEAAGVACIGLGLILFCHAFVLFQRKRAIENCPTSRVRSLPMGEVEVKGHARQREPVRSPYSYTDCVYYSYEIYTREAGLTRSLRKSGNSGLVPFYLEDETGTVLILPQEAIVQAGVTQTLYGISGMNAQNVLSNVPENSIVKERIIPVGGVLYVTGFARPLRTSGLDSKRLLVEKMRSLKKNPARLKKYDVNGDGRIDGSEWEAARVDMEDEAMIEGMSAPVNGDRIAIGPHPLGGLYYISDKKEKVIVKTMMLRMTGFFVLGPGCILGGLYFVLKLMFA